MGSFDIWQDFKKGLWPNIITTIGLILAPFAVYFHKNEWFFLAMWPFTLSWICDFFDGYISRKFNGISQIGSFYDPLADKITTMIYLLYFWDKINPIISILIITLGFSLTVLRIYKIYYGKKKNIEYNIMAKWAGKIKTNIEKSSFALIFLFSFFSSNYLYFRDENFVFYLDCFINLLLATTLFFAGLSLANQIKEIS